MFSSLWLIAIYSLRIPVQQSTVDQIPRVGVHHARGNMNNVINVLAMLAAVACIASARVGSDREDDTYLEKDRDDLDNSLDNSIDDIWSSDDNEDDQTPYATTDGIYYKVYPKKDAAHNKKYPANDKAADGTRKDDVEATDSDLEGTTAYTFLSFILSLLQFPLVLFESSPDTSVITTVEPTQSEPQEQTTPGTSLSIFFEEDSVEESKSTAEPSSSVYSFLAFW